MSNRQISELLAEPVGMPTRKAEGRSHMEIQRVLRDEIHSLCAVLDQQVQEIATLTLKVQELEAKSAAAIKLQVALIHKLYAIRENGPAAGAPTLERQAEVLTKSPLFDGEWYLKTYPDVAATGLTAAEHYVRVGAFEGRDPGPNFDTIAYFLANPDVAEAGWPALVHYAVIGQAKKRRLR